MEHRLASAMVSETQRRERERRVSEREGRERLPIDAGRRGVGARVGNGRGELTYGWHSVAAHKPRSTVQIFNSTSKVRLNIYISPFLTPNPLRSGTKRSNQCCRATRYLQHFLKDQSLIRPGWRDTSFQSGVAWRRPPASARAPAGLRLACMATASCHVSTRSQRGEVWT